MFKFILTGLGIMGFSVAATASTIYIENCEQLQDIGLTSETLNGYYLQSADIDCSEIPNFTPIGDALFPFTGYYNGLGHEITGLTINNTTSTGLFGFISGAHISFVGLVDYEITGGTGPGTAYYEATGALIGYAEHSIIDESYARNGIVKGTNNTGGLIGQIFSTAVSNTDTTSDVFSQNYTGGLIGSATGGYDGPSIISKSYASGRVESQYDTGGLIGFAYNDVEISNSYASGDVVGRFNTGGLIGELGFSTIKDSYAIGKIIGSTDSQGLGGLVGNSLGSNLASAVYWDTETSGTVVSAEGEGRTTNQMKLIDSSESIYEGWDPEVWYFEVGQYPTL
ncbi:MAG: GLUG motif-containing protein [Legionellales bacterium]|jgi:hypothetical protein